MKIIGYTIVGVLLLCIGFIVGRANIPTPFNEVADAVSTAVVETVQQDIIKVTEEDTSNAPETQTVNTASDATITSNTPITVPEEGVAISSNLSVEQKAMLKSFGINPDTFVLTVEMIACAEKKLGSVRMAEIQSGATPTFLEGASLIGCYQ